MSQERITYPPLVAHGPDNKGAVVVVVSYSFMFITILFAILRAWSSHMQKRELRWDDVTFSLAVLLIIPETVLTERAVHEGLGQHISNVTVSKLAQYYKYIFVTQILGIIIQALAKFSVLLMVERIAFERSTKKSNLLLKIAVGVWRLRSFNSIPGLFPKYLSSDDETWYSANVQILQQAVINLSVIAAGILSVRRFLSELQTGRLGTALNDREIELTTGQRKVRSANISKTDHSQNSVTSGRWQRNIQDQNPESHIQSNVSVLNNSHDLHLRPDRTARYTTHVVGGGSSDNGTRRDARERKAHLGDMTKSDDDITDDKSTSSLKKNGVYQQRDFEMHVEYDYHDGESG